jgi:hypothetical protein
MKRTARAPSQLSESMHKRLSAYTLAASAAGVGVLALTMPAEARIIYSPQTIKIDSPECTLFNPAGELKAPFCFGRIFTAPGSGSIWGAAIIVGLDTSGAGFVTAASNSAAALKRGKAIGSMDRFQNRGLGYLATSGPFFGGTSNNHRGGFQFGHPAFLGISFPIRHRNHYGWARITIHHDGEALYGVIKGYAYETIPNKPIVAGKTHGKDDVSVEPASLGHLVTGASAIPDWRRSELVPSH